MKLLAKPLRVREDVSAVLRRLHRCTACWLGNSKAAKLSLWSAMGIVLAKELALPPYLTWTTAALWWVISCLRLVLRGRGRIGHAVLTVLVVLSGAANFSSYWYSVQNGLACLAEAEGPVSVIAQVLEAVSDNPSRQRLTVEVRGVLLPEGVWSQQGRVVITHVAADDHLDRIEPGDVVLAQAEFRRPRRASNPGQFDYAHYLYRRGVSLTAFAEGKDAVRRFDVQQDPQIREVLARGRWFWAKTWRAEVVGRAQRLKQRLVGVWEGSLPARYQGLLAAMVFGDDTLLDEDVERAFRRTGQAHLLSVSGLHVGFAAGWLWYLGSRFSRGRLVSYALGILAAWGYAFLAGGSPPVVRAATTLSLYLAAAALGRDRDRLAGACCAAFLQLWANPSLLFDISFQLSYGALFGILALAKPLEAWLLPKRLAGTPLASGAAKISAPVIVSVSAQLSIFPLLSWYFQEIPLLGPLLGLAAVPTAGIVVPLALAGSLVGLVFPAQRIVGPILLRLLALLDRLLDLCSSWDWAVLYSGAGSAALWVCYYAVLVLLVQYLNEAAVYPRLGLAGTWWRSQRKRLALAGLLAGVWIVYMPLLAPLWRPLEITFLDVGQGDAIFVSTPTGRNLLIDGGGLPSSSTDGGFDAGERIVLPFLKYRGVRRLDLVIATHFHNDHTQGLKAVLRELSVGLLGDNGLLDAGFASREYGELLKELAKRKDITRIALRRGQRFQLSRGVELLVLHPAVGVERNFHNDGPATTVDQNNNSVVLKLLTPNFSALFTGDIDREAQLELLQHHLQLDFLRESAVPNGAKDGQRLSNSESLRDKFGLKADILKVPHHGARRALVYSFLGAVSPELAVVSVGRNPHGHPAAEVLQALEAVTGSAPLRTDAAGCITIKAWGKRMVIDTFHAPAFWEVGSWAWIRHWEARLKDAVQGLAGRV